MQLREIHRAKSIKFGKIIIVIGILFGTFSAVIPFAEIGNEEVWNILYNRGMLFGFMLASFGGMLILWKTDIFISSLLLGLGGGITGELLISSYNLMCDGCMVTYYYFMATFLISFFAFITCLIIRA